MIRVFIADAHLEERTALRLLLVDMNMEVVGEAANWLILGTKAPVSSIDMLLVEWDLLPNPQSAALAELRRACQTTMVIVLISHLDTRQQAALSVGADAFISKGETPDRVAERLQAIAASIPTK